MKILLTGAAGVLGSGLSPELAQRHDVRLLDMAEVKTALPFCRVNLLDFEATKKACEGIELAVHCAAIHPWKKYTDEQYLDWNIKATYNLLKAAAEAGVRKVVYTSSVAAMGFRPASLDELPFTESKPCTPDENLYGVSKLVGEHFADLFVRSHGLAVISLRPGVFIPTTPEPQQGLSYLTHRVSVEDLVEAHALAVNAFAEGRITAGHERFIITSETPWRREDAETLRDAPLAAIGKYFPKAVELLQRKGIKVPPIVSFYSIEKAKRVLGYRPQFGFARWLERQGR
ncbi:MAG: NAD(P)-dependent oxidoreductase [Planctomycetes bacterium]|nr:NAD(P)-dependent oxidoreductase [Planctomycetota bacterium]